MQLFLQLKGEGNHYPVKKCTFVQRDADFPNPYKDHLEIEIQVDGDVDPRQWLKQVAVLLFKTISQVDKKTMVVSQWAELKEGYQLQLSSLLTPLTWEQVSGYHSAGNIPELLHGLLKKYDGFLEKIDFKLNKAYLLDKTQLQFQETDHEFLHKIACKNNISYFLQHSDNGCSIIFSDDKITSNDPEKYSFEEKKGLIYPAKHVFQLKKIRQLVKGSHIPEEYWVAKSHCPHFKEGSNIVIDGHPVVSFNRLYYVFQVQHHFYKAHYENTLILTEYPVKSAALVPNNRGLTTGVIFSEKDQAGYYEIQLDGIPDKKLAIKATPIFSSFHPRGAMQLPYKKGQQVILLPDNNVSLIVGSLLADNSAIISQIQSEGESAIVFDELSEEDNSLKCISGSKQLIKMLCCDNKKTITVDGSGGDVAMRADKLSWNNQGDYKLGLGDAYNVQVDGKYSLQTDHGSITADKGMQQYVSDRVKLSSDEGQIKLEADNGLSLGIDSGVNIAVEEGDFVLRSDVLTLRVGNSAQFFTTHKAGWRIKCAESEIVLNSRGDIHLISNKIHFDAEKILFNGSLQYCN